LATGSSLSLVLGYEGNGWATLIAKDDFSTWTGVYGISTLYVPRFSDNAFGRFGLKLVFDWPSGSMPVYEDLNLVAGVGYGIPVGGNMVEARGALTFYISSTFIHPVINVEFKFSPVAGGV
jgi:hypothetical protein